MRGTDPTKSKWECPTMLYRLLIVIFLDITIFYFILFVIVGSGAIFYLIYV